MRKKLFLSIIIVFGLMLTSCSRFDRQVARFENSLHQQQEKALLHAHALEKALLSNSIDSVRLATADAEGILFYVLGSNGMVYWSDNWLSGSGVMYPKFGKWFYYHFENAECVCRWSQSNGYNILTIIPVKYDYPIENDQLHNTFIKPFRLPKNVKIRQTKTEGSLPVYDVDGKYLLSLVHVPEAVAEKEEQTRVAESFSYQSLLSTDPAHGHRRIHFYILTCVGFFLLLFIFGVFGIVRNRGFANMRLSQKFQYLIVMMLLMLFVYVIVAATTYMKERYEMRQMNELQQKTRYIQKSLQDLYFWNMSLSQQNTQGMNVDLRDLCFSYESDINVYDMSGNLIGSSSPAIFEKGILSTHIHPEPFFSKQSTMVRNEHIGDMNYLAAYTEFYNGNYVQIGYIEVPFYVATDERHMAMDDFLSRLFPPYLLMMILAVILALLISRGLTRPLSALSDAMKDVRIGKDNKHLLYAHNDEVGEIVERYNAMLDQLEESTEKLARTEREGAWRTMARQIAHEINNNLTPMKLNIQMLQMLKKANKNDLFEEKFDPIADSLIGQIDSLSNIATSFSSYAKLPEVQTSMVDVAVQLYSVINFFRENAEHTPIRYVGAEHGIYAVTDNEQIRQVFTNLIKNALQAINGADNGDIIVILKDMNESVEISISDNGGGIPQELKDKVFMPYFTTKTTGTGLGLGIAKNIVEGSGGKIWFNTSSKGTTFFIRLHK